MIKRSIHDYAAALYEAVSEQPEARATIVQRFVAQLARDRNRHLLPLIADALADIEAERIGAIRAKVSTAKALTDEQRGQVVALLRQKYPNSKQVNLEESVDTSLLGGLQIQVQGQTIDHSIKSKLASLAARL